MSWPTTADAVITNARRDIGLGEYPNGSNHNKITAWYGIGNGAWCAMAVAYWFHQSGVNLRKLLDSPGWAYTPSGVVAARNHGLWHEDHHGIKRGDVVFYRLPGAEGNDFVNHVGIVESVDSYAVRSIEGNTANVVAERTRSRSLIVGYLRPPYRSAGTTKPSPLVPLFPGADAFKLGKSNPAVTKLDAQLVRLGYTKHNDGNGYQPGPVFTAYTRDNIRDFQHAQGWKGKDADGYPGPDTWRLLFTTRTAA